MNKKVVLTSELFDCGIPYLREYFEEAKYPWELLPKIKEIIKKVLENGLPGYTLLKEGVLVGENVTISPTATIIPPAIIGSNTEIRPGAYIRGNLICGDNCVLGNSCEFKNAIILYHVQVPHYSYVGDSILGNYAHMGAGSICSNLKSDGKNIVIHGEEEYETGLIQVRHLLFPVLPLKPGLNLLISLLVLLRSVYHHPDTGCQHSGAQEHEQEHPNGGFLFLLFFHCFPYCRNHAAYD